MLPWTYTELPTYLAQQLRHTLTTMAHINTLAEFIHDRQYAFIQMVEAVNNVIILLSFFFLCFFFYFYFIFSSPQWGAADAEIKVPSGENTELKRSPFQAWSRSVYSHTCYAYCQGFLLCLFLHFRSIHLHFFQNLSRNFSCVGCS